MSAAVYGYRALSARALATAAASDALTAGAEREASAGVRHPAATHTAATAAIHRPWAPNMSGYYPIGTGEVTSLGRGRRCASGACARRGSGKVPALLS